MKIRISNRHSKYILKKLPIKRFCKQILEVELGDSACELDISVVSNDEIASLNEHYLHHEGPTDVISFPQAQTDSGGFNSNQLGDIVVSADMAYAQSQSYATSLNQEFGLYIIHGILHLLGYDDLEESAKKVMVKKQDFWFNKLLKSNECVFISLK